MSKTMITSSDLRVKYETLYEFLMQFLWEFEVVQDLAYLEIAIYQAFPDKDEMVRCLNELKRDISYTYNEMAEDDDADFKEAFEDLEGAINDYDPETVGFELYNVEEVVDDPEDKIDASEDIDISEGKRKFKFGDITKTTKEERELQEEAARTLSNPFENTEE